MKYAAIILAFAAAVAVGQEGSCSPDLNTNAFTFQTMNVTSSSKRSMEDQLLEKRQSISCGKSVELHLQGSVLNDAKGRTGYIASNDQFQFDGPPQAGYKQTDGFSVCTITAQNQRLALDGKQIFYNCLSGTFNNIYSSKQGEQCYEVYIQVFPCIPDSPIPTAPVNSVPFPSGTLSAESGSVSAAPETSEAASSSAEPTISMVVMTAQPETPSPVATPSAIATPYPVGNSSVAATGSAPGTPVTTSPAGVSPPPSKFTGAANIVAVGQKLVGVAAGVAAFALL